MNTHETVKRFAERKPNPRQGGNVAWKGNVGYPGNSGGGWGGGHIGPRIYCVGNTLYSYGPHFPLAVYLGERDGKKLFLKNGDRWSMSTNGQQSTVQSLCPGPTASFSALNTASNVRPTDFTLENIVDFHADTRIDLVRSKDGVFYHRGDRGEVFTPPKQGAFMSWNDTEENGDTAGQWHILAACLLNVSGRYLLSAIDEGSYFVSEIPVPVKTIEDTFAQLKPREVRKAEAKGATVHRQGEWYFIATGIDNDKALAKALNLPNLSGQLKFAGLPRRSDQENIHRAWIVDHAGDLFARGTVRHVFELRRYVPKSPYFGKGGRMIQTVVQDGFTYRSTREHAALKLGAEWHRVYRNTELGSWTSRGKVD